MTKCSQALVLNLQQQITISIQCRKISTDHSRVDKHTNHRLHFLADAAGNGDTNIEALLPGVTMQQQIKSCQQCHKERGTFLLGDTG